MIFVIQYSNKTGKKTNNQKIYKQKQDPPTNLFW